MPKVKVQWLGAAVIVPALDRKITAGDELEMEEVEARDREAAGQVRIITESAKRKEG